MGMSDLLVAGLVVLVLATVTNFTEIGGSGPRCKPVAGGLVQVC